LVQKCLNIFVGFPWLTSYGKLDEEYGFIAMDLLGSNSLEVLRKLEQRKAGTERYYGFPLASIVSIAVKLVSPLICYSLSSSTPLPFSIDILSNFCKFRSKV
jgi:hypothetical protein